MAVYPSGVATDTDLYVAKDRSTSALSGGINNSTLSVGVTDGTQFIAKQIITIDDEQMQIDSISTNTLTVISRGLAGTSAASHSSGATVKGNIVSLHHNALKDEIKAMQGVGRGATSGNFSSRPAASASMKGQIYFSTDTPGLISQCDGSAWFDFIGGTSVTLPAASGSWTAVNGGTLTQSGGALYYEKATSGLGIVLIAIPSPSSSWDLRMCARPLIWLPNQECGLWVSQGTTAGTDTAYGLALTIAPAIVPVAFQRNYAPINGSLGDTGSINVPLYPVHSPPWFRLTKSGTTITSYIGDGTDWIVIGTFTASSLTHYGFGVDPRASTSAAIKVHGISIV